MATPQASERRNWVISGISCRLPESDNMAEFRDNLLNNVDMVTETDRRWKPGTMGLPLRTGTIKDLTKFDATYFSVHPKQTNNMDPQIRMLMEITHEAIVDAGVNPSSIRGSRTGVFIGAQLSETSYKLMEESTSPYTLTGNVMSMFANRLSFSFDLKGPSLTVDTACSSGLYAVDIALSALRNGECDAAIVGGASLTLLPTTNNAFKQLGVLSPAGKCKSFDKDGDGYARSEGIAAIFLQKEEVAKRIYCKVINSKTNSDGNKQEGITFPSYKFQKQLLREVYDDVGLDPRQLTYVEAHATGTAAGDPVEANAITDELCKDRDSPLMIGCVKSNMGHCESASGIAAIAKVVIAMEGNVIPSNLHYNEPNPDIPGLANGKLNVISENRKWTGGIVGINSFGFGGSNAHLILKSNPKEGRHIERCKKPRLFVYGSRTQEGVEVMLEAARKNCFDMNFHALAAETSNMAVDVFPYRGFTLLNTTECTTSVENVTEQDRPVWFVFSGMGSQWSGMGRALMEIEVFRNSISKSDAILKQHGIDLYDTIMEQKELGNDVVKAFVGITSIQVALVDLLSSVGIKPDGLVGHSVGELGCAYADGSLTATEAILAAYWRGHCVQSAKLPPGGMAAVGMTWQEALDQCPPGVVPACHNSEESVTVSGPVEEVRKFVEDLKNKGTFAKLVDSAGVAFHSYFMKDVATSLKTALDKVIVSKPRTDKWISSSFPESEWSSDMAKNSSADYHVHNLISPVLFHDAISHVPSNAVVIEIAPHCLLQSLLRGSLGSNCCILGLMKRNHADNQSFLLTALGKCYQQGVNLDPLKLVPPVQFPVPKGTPMISPLVRWDHTSTWHVVKAKDETTDGSSFEIDLSNGSEDSYLLEHVINGRPILPYSAFIVFVWKAVANRKGEQWDAMPIQLKDFTVHRSIPLKADSKVRLDISFTPGSDDFQVLESNEVVCNGKVTVPDSKTLKAYFTKEINDKETTNEPFTFKTEDFYKELLLKGYSHGPSFQSITACLSEGIYGQVKWTGNWIKFLDAITHLNILKTSKLALPVSKGMIVIDPAEHDRKLRNAEKAGTDLPLWSDKIEFNFNRCGGVHLQDAYDVFNRQSRQKAATCESYSFVPYTRQIGLDCEDKSLKDYMDQCSAFSKTISESNFKNMQAPTNGLRVVNEKTSGPNQHSFLKLLNDMNGISSEADMHKELCEQSAESLETDILLSNLLQTEVLKPCLDVVWENVGWKNVKMLEISKRRITGRLQGLIHPFLDVTNAVATMDITDAENLSNEHSDIEILNWEPGNNVPYLAEKFTLVAFDNVLRKQKNIRNTLKDTASLLKEGGFILIHEFSSNLHLAALVDGIQGISHHSCNDLNERKHVNYCDAATWRRLFEEEGFEIIYEVSDMLSSLFLIRERSKSKVEQQIFLHLDGQTFDWVDQLKEKFAEVGNKAKGENLWLKADGADSGILGMVNCLRNEPGGEKLRCIFNMDGAVLDDIATENLVKRDVAINILKEGQWGSYRHMPIVKVPMVASRDAFVMSGQQGDLSTLAWHQSLLSAETDSTDIVDVHYASLNFRDVMLATGKIATESIPCNAVDMDHMLGTEFSGVDVGGRRVMGMIETNGLATRVKAHKRTTWPVPDNWSLEDAATVPVVYATAFYALVVRGNIGKGNSVLIHSGTGGVGQAAIRIALSYGCKVFTTVGTDEKRQYLKERFPQLDDGCIFNSRDTGFELGIKLATAAKGVDIVLNSLSEEKLHASVRCLAKFGKFLEIGKYDLSKNSPLGMNVFLKNIAFHGILLDGLFAGDNGELETVSRCLLEGIKSGVVKPLRAMVFDTDNVEDAFRYMAQGKHIGKVLIKIRNEPGVAMVPAHPRCYFYSNKTYIITGGLGGFGLELAHWLVERGAMNLILTSRSGVRTGYQRRKLCVLKDIGAEVTVSNKNICYKEEVRQLIKSTNGRPVGGIFHLAVVLKDAIIENQTKDNFETVAGPKVKGTINLDQVTRELCKDSLDYFVVFSSTSCGYGHPGQTPYGYANSVMERLVEKRKSDGLPGLAIQWGPIGDVGVFINQIGDNDTVVGGTVPQRIYSCMQTLELFMNQSEPIACCYVAVDKSSSETTNANRDLVSAICHILGAKNPDSIDKNRSLADIGLDSLLVLELKLLLENQYNIRLSDQEIRDASIKKLKDMECSDKTLVEKAKKSLDTDHEVLPKRLVRKLNAVEEGVPLFVLHAFLGSVFQTKYVTSQIKVPAYGIERSAEVPLDSLEAMAAFYAQTIEDMVAGGPFHLAGYSMGAVIVQEIVLYFQEKGRDIKSVILMDGSSQFTKTHIQLSYSDAENKRNDERNLTKVFFQHGLGISLKELSNEEHIQRIAKRLIEMMSGLSLEDARIIAKANINCVKWGLYYNTTGKYRGDIHLIKAESSTHLPGVTEDYGLNEFCTGRVFMETVPGDHLSHLTNESGDQVARLMNNIITGE